jgi:APA family basic amino acid/polyamine antiporter
MGWLSGWLHTIEFGVSVMVMARAWSKNLLSWCLRKGLTIPTFLYATGTSGHLIEPEFFAFLLCFIFGVLLSRGAHFGTKLNVFFVLFNLLALCFIIITGSCFVDPSNWNPYFPYGYSGVVAGGGEMFFAYLGFDGITNLAGRAKNPNDVPLSVTVTNLFATILYIIIICTVLRNGAL